MLHNESDFIQPVLKHMVDGVSTFTAANFLRGQSHKAQSALCEMAAPFQILITL